VPIPGLRTEYGSGFPVLVVDDVGILDDRGIENIMDATFEDIRSKDRWRLSPRSWFMSMCDYATSPFLKSPLNLIGSWKYKGKVYDNSSVNYIGLGYAAAHFICPLHFSWRFRSMNRNWPYIWNLQYLHLPGADQFWFNKGYDLYPGWKVDWLDIINIF
jgi:hypothetical protein